VQRVRSSAMQRGIGKGVTPMMLPPTALPGTLKRARFDTVVLIPASLLPFKLQWQQIADDLPSGSALIIVPTAGSPQSEAAAKIAAGFAAMGRSVNLLPASKITKARQLRLLVG
jgi:hypothetical protein